MSKGLEALKTIDERFNTLKRNGAYVPILEEELIIEKELKEGEENKKMLNIFKNALTIEHHEIAELDHSQDANDYFVRTLFNIEQNQIDNAIRKTLREWVLKNAFLKELKALEIIKELPDKYKEGLIYILLNALNEREISQEQFDSLKEVLL